MIDYEEDRENARPLSEGSPYVFFDEYRDHYVDAWVRVYRGPSGRYYLFTEEMEDPGDVDLVGREEGYRTLEKALDEADEIAQSLDEGDGLSAEEADERRLKEALSRTSETGDWVVVWGTDEEIEHSQGDIGNRYYERVDAELEIRSWFEGARARHGGSLIWGLMRTPHLGRVLEDGSIEIVEDDDYYDSY